MATATKELALGRPGAEKRMAEIRKEKGAKEAKQIQAKAQEIAVAAGSRNIKLEHIAEAEGTKLTPEQIAEYRGRKPAAKKPAAKKPAAKKPAGETGKTSGADATENGNGRGNAAAAPAPKESAAKKRSSRPKTAAGSDSSNGSSKTEQLRKLREQAAEEKGETATLI
jgi:hypothetical protein